MLSPQKNTPVQAVPSAAVVLVRASASPFEVLLVRRNPELAFHGGAWVFPGGRMEPEELSREPSELSAARISAVRELHEETSLHADPDALRALSCWTTPEELPRRFRAWFFMGQAEGEQAVKVDGGEIHGHIWTTPANALASAARGEIELPPAVFVTLTLLEPLASAAEALALAHDGPTHYEPRSVYIAEGRVALYQRDAGYTARTLDVHGPRDRLWALHSGMRYERTLG